MDSLKCCTLCPRECKVDRTKGVGFCGATDKVFVARASLHFWEEPPISGERGSGTVFFSHCTLKCVFCQNREISYGGVGREVSIQRLGEIFLQLQQKSAENINLVTPTHYIPQIIRAINSAKQHGLKIPIVYNTSGYEKVETLRLLDGAVDIYLPDFKYYDSRFSKRYSKCEDYFDFVGNAIEEMLSQVGECEFDKRGMMKKGVIVRHMVLPNLLDDSKRILKYLNRRFGDKIMISIMSQYTPFGDLSEYPEISMPLSKEDYDEILEYADMIGITNGFTQEGESAKESFIPPFDLSGV